MQIADRNAEVGPITTDWFKSLPGERQLATNLQIGRVMTAFFGMDAISLCRRLMANMSFSREEADVIDSYFLKSSKRIYKLPRQTDPQEFYLQQHRGALAVVRYFGELVPELAGEWESKDEIPDLSDRPSDLLRLLAKPASNIDPKLAYEAQRHAALMYQLGMINARTLNGRLRTVLSDTNRLLNSKLFKGPEGHGDPTFLESFHDDETNEVVGFPDRNNRRPLTAHLKRTRMVVRNTREWGAVRTKSRKKDDSVAITKSWEKALGNGGTIHLDNAIQDSIGKEYVLMDDSILSEQFADLVVSIIEAEAGVRSDLWEIPRIVKVEKDDKADNDRGQSVVPSFNARRKIWFENIPTPIELKFYDRKTYLNSILEVGTRSYETGLYMGRAHDLFQLRRCRNAVRVPFPEEMYPISDYDLNIAFVNRSKQVAYALRAMHKAG